MTTIPLETIRQHANRTLAGHSPISRRMMFALMQALAELNYELVPKGAKSPQFDPEDAENIGYS